MVRGMGEGELKVHNWIDTFFFSFQMVWLSRVCGKEEVGSCLCSDLGNKVPRQVCESQTGIKTRVGEKIWETKEAEAGAGK